MTKAERTFRAKVPWAVELLKRDFGFSNLDAYAIMGNFGHESVGLSVMQEIAPVVKGSKGGWGWPQWTGPRRRAFEDYADRNGFGRASDRANYNYVFVELKGPERRAVDAVKNAKGLYEKTRAFELAFERAGKKNYKSRYAWSKLAKKYHQEALAAGEIKLPYWAGGKDVLETPVPSDKPEQETTSWFWRLLMRLLGIK